MNSIISQLFNLYSILSKKINANKEECYLREMYYNACENKTILNSSNNNYGIFTIPEITYSQDGNKNFTSNITTNYITMYTLNKNYPVEATSIDNFILHKTEGIYDYSTNAYHKTFSCSDSSVIKTLGNITKIGFCSKNHIGGNTRLEFEITGQGLTENYTIKSFLIYKGKVTDISSYVVSDYETTRYLLSGIINIYVIISISDDTNCPTLNIMIVDGESRVNNSMVTTDNSVLFTEFFDYINSVPVCTYLSTNSTDSSNIFRLSSGT